MSLLPEINQASAEINKFVAQANIHRAIAPVDPAEFTSPADTLLLASRDPVIREVSVGMTGVEAAPCTVSGTPPLSLPNSLGEPLTAWSVDVSPYQEGTGDPSPSNVRAIHGTDKLNMFVEDSYDQSATPKAVITLPQTVYTGTIGSEVGESRDAKYVFTGNETWNASSAPHRFSCYLDNYVSEPIGTMPMIEDAEQDAISEVFGQLVYKNADNVAYFVKNRLLVINVPSASTVSDIQQITAGTALVYKMANPQTFTIATPPIPTPTGTASTWATAEDATVHSMEVTYYKSE